MNHLTETDLIAFHLNELSSGVPTEAAIRSHVELCPECAAVSDSIAQTLRIFSAEPVPTPNLEHNWQRLRGSLPALPQVAPKPRRLAAKVQAFLFRPTIGLAFAALLVAVTFGLRFSHIRVTHTHTPVNTAINGHGPLTTEPTDPAIASHLDAAERLLTEVDHASGPLDAGTRNQAHVLLLSNAVYTRSARDRGDVAQAAVLDNLGRVLITLDNAPATPSSTLDLRVEMNTSGLLFEIRILRQNENRQ
jgi:hypothetical protein